MHSKVFIRLVPVFFFACLLPQLRAQILAEALSDFPPQTELLEYDNLAQLRALPNYDALKQRFTGKQLERLKTALTKIDLPESAVDEIVMASSPAGFYGLISGTFSGAAITQNAVTKGCAFLTVEDNKILCPTAEMSVLFLTKSLAAFGTSAEIKRMLEARRGAAPRFSTNLSLVHLLNQTERDAPVRGVSSGSQLTASLVDAMQGGSSLDIDWSRLASNISAFGYSVKLDSKAHVAATLQCKSPATAAILRQTLGALSALQSVAAKAGASAPFENLQLSSSGIFIGLQMDTPLPAR